MQQTTRIEVPKTADRSGCALLHEIVGSMEVYDPVTHDVIVKAVCRKTPNDEGVVCSLHLNWVEEAKQGLMWTMFFEDGLAECWTEEGLFMRFDGWKIGLSRTRNFIKLILQNRPGSQNDTSRFNQLSFT